MHSCLFLPRNQFFFLGMKGKERPHLLHLLHGPAGIRTQGQGCTASCVGTWES
jgi:hypothetical protein